MEQRLKEAAQEGNINKLYELIQEDQCLLEPIDRKPFVDTPLHIAAAAGNTLFALEIMRLKPSFARKPNPHGFSPMHLALKNDKIQTVRRLVNVDPDLIRVKGREGVTPLHYVAETGNPDLLAFFLTVCPKSFEDLTIRNETALHVALKNDMPVAFQVLLGGLHQLSISDGSLALKDKVLNWKDEDGNTVLHIAALANKTEAVRMLVANGANPNAKNSEGSTVLDILVQSELNIGTKFRLSLAGALKGSQIPSVTRADYLRRKLSALERLVQLVRKTFYISKDSVHAMVVVAGFVLTTTYQAGLNPPGGVWPDDSEPPNNVNTTTNATNTTLIIASSRPPHRAGTTVLTPNNFYDFASLNSTAFYLSIAIILILVPRGPFGFMLQTLLIVLLVCHTMSVSITSGLPSQVYISSVYISVVMVISTFLSIMRIITVWMPQTQAAKHASQ